MYRRFSIYKKAIDVWNVFIDVLPNDINDPLLTIFNSANISVILTQA